MIAEESLYGIHGDGPGYGEDKREGVGPWGAQMFRGGISEGVTFECRPEGLKEANFTVV